MSHSDSFIDEVTQEVRRDRLFGLFRRWAWLAILLIVLVVGLAAWNEWRKARERWEAQALGDAIVTALDADDPDSRAASLALVEADGAAETLLSMLLAAESAGGGDVAAATVALDGEAARQDAGARWSDLAALKLVLLTSTDLAPEERIARLEPLTAPGRPYRLLALEQIALARVEAGENDVAVAILRDLIADEAASEGLRRRARQLMVALGATVEPA